jgi:hypothetical protein
MSIKIWEYGVSAEQVSSNTTNIQIVEGNPFTTSAEFLSDTGAPLEPLSGFPIVKVMEDGNELITSSVGYIKTQQNNGQWFADLTIPTGIDFSESGEKVLTLTWIFKTAEESQKETLNFTILPRNEEVSDDYKELVLLGPVGQINISVPYIINLVAGDSVDFTLYDENTALLSSVASGATINGAKTTLVLDVSGSERQFTSRLRPYNLVLTIRFSNGIAARQIFSQVYQINPSLLSAMQSLEMSINKANQIETIKGLQFREADLLQGLTRGLDYFNNVPPSLTSFNGICMTGTIREGWLVCSSIRVLRAQLQAEGWFNFDFSGQNISVSVDRTQAVDTACGHYESLIDTLVRPLKMLLAKKGIISGDGSLGDRLASMSQMGVTRLSNTTITRSRMGSAIYPRNW